MSTDVSEYYNDNLYQDFTQFLPLIAIENIFLYLDLRSICWSAQVSKRWNKLINNSDYIWKSILLSLHGNLDISSNAPYKTLVKQQYKLVQAKKRWNSGRFSFISSFQNLQRLCPSHQFSKEDWGDILQAELSR